MKLSTILVNYSEFTSSYKKVGYAQPTININDKRQFRLLIDKVISDIILFNDLLNIYDYDSKEKKQILAWLNKLGYKRETFIQMLIERNVENLAEDMSISDDEYSDMQLFESEIQDEIENMEFITEDFDIEDEIDNMEFITEAKKATIAENTLLIEEYFKEYEISLSRNFNLRKFAKDLDHTTLTTLLCNMDNVKVMKDIAKGNYNSFDIYDSEQFNDSYEEMMEDLGLSEDDEDFDYDSVDED